MKRTWRKKILLILSGAMTVTALAFTEPAVGRAYVQTTGTITTDAAKVRKEPSTSSDTLATVIKGSPVIVVDEVTDSAGMLWYKVNYTGGSGYIRSDLMVKTTAAASTVTTTSTTLSSTGTSAANTAATQVTAIAETKAYVNYESVRVRQTASAQGEIVGSAVKNTPVVITGEAKATDGKKWYQVKYTNQNNREIVGFIRSDLLTVGDPPAPPVTQAPAETPAETSTETPAEQPEGTEAGEGEAGEGGAEEGGEVTGEGGEGQQIPEPEPAPVETVKQDYEMVYEANSEGVEEWFLHDNISNTRQSLANLREWADTGERLSQTVEKQASTQKIIIIVLGVLVAVLVVVVMILLFRIKDMYEDEEEDDEDEDEEEEEDEDEDEEEEEVRPVRRRRPVANAEEKPQKPQRPAPAPKTRQVRESDKKSVPVKRVEYDPEEEEFEAGQPAVEKPQPKRKAKNFLIEDDEFEFEFLNMDDKK